MSRCSMHGTTKSGPMMLWACGEIQISRAWYCCTHTGVASCPETQIGKQERKTARNYEPIRYRVTRVETTRTYGNEILQCRGLDNPQQEAKLKGRVSTHLGGLYGSSQSSNLSLDPRVSFLQFDLLHAGLFPHPSWTTLAIRYAHVKQENVPFSKFKSNRTPA